jgi:hypothetical protein
MNAEQLKQNIGQRLRLVPHPIVVPRHGPTISTLSSDGPRYEKHGTPADYDWILEEVTTKAVTLSCPFTGHRVTLGHDNMREYRSPRFLMLRCQLYLDGDQVRIVPQ